MGDPFAWIDRIAVRALMLFAAFLGVVVVLAGVSLAIVQLMRLSGLI